MTLQIVGQHKGYIELNLNSSTVLNLKEAVSRASGLPIAGLKLLAGELPLWYWSTIMMESLPKHLRLFPYFEDMPSIC